MNTALLTWLNDHKWWLVVVAVAFGAGRFGHQKPVQTIQVKETEKKVEDNTSSTNTHRQEGPKDIEIDVGGWASPLLPPNCQQAIRNIAKKGPPRAAVANAVFDPTDGFTMDEINALPPGTEIHIHEGPVVEDSSTKDHDLLKDFHTSEVKTNVVDLPNVSLSVGFLDPLEVRSLQFGAGYKLIDRLPLVGLPIWIKGTWVPVDGLHGLSVMAETQFYFKGL